MIKGLNPAEKILNIIHEKVISNNITKNRTHFYVTDVSKCSRRVFFEFFPKIPRKSKDSQVLLKFLEGNSIHEKLVKLLSEYIENIESSIIHKSGAFELHGRIDAVIRMQNVRYVVEIKSINTFSYKKIIKDNQPLLRNIEQLQMYMHLTGIHNGIILYEDKNNQELMPFYIKYDPLMGELLMTKLHAINSAIITKKVPNKDYQEDWECKYCDYHELCEPEDLFGEISKYIEVHEDVNR